MHRPRAVYPGSLGGVAAPFVLLLCPWPHALSATHSPVPPVSLAPSCRLRVHRRPRIGSSVPFFSSASPASLSHHILLVCPHPSTPVLHAHRSQLHLPGKFPGAGLLRRRQSTVSPIVVACALRAHFPPLAAPLAAARHLLPPCLHRESSQLVELHSVDLCVSPWCVLIT